jgi:4-amino-4-deoxy-L-arabinose transferase-like glycosyltransferase
MRLARPAPAVSVSRAPRRVWPLLTLLAIGGPLLFSALGLSLLDPDEGLYADIANRMRAAGGDWVIPHFNGLPYLEKPPLYFWLTALTLTSGEHAEWTLRAWSALMALGTALLTWRMGRRLYGDRAGVYAGLMLLTTVGYALYVRKASTDFVFVFCLTLALYGFLRDTEHRRGARSRFLLLYVGAGLAVLAKGLIGVVFPAVIVALTLARVRGGLSVKDLNLGRGLAVFGLVTLPWHLAAAWRAPALFWFYLVDNQVLRFLDRRAFVEDDVPLSTLGFLLVTFVWLFPWSVFVLARGTAAGSRAARWRPGVLIWALVIVGFFAASRSKLEYYALPAFPALAMLVAAAWATGRDIGRWMWAGLVGTLVVGGAAVWVGGHLTPSRALAGLAELNVYYRILRDQGLPLPPDLTAPLGVLVQLTGVSLIVGWALAATLWVRGRRHAAFGALLGLGALIGVLVVQLLYLVEPYHSAKAVAHAFSAGAAKDDILAHEGSLEYSAALPFYTGRRVVVVEGTRGDLDIASRSAEAAGYFIDGAELARLWGAARRVFLVTQTPPDRGVIGRLPVDSVHALGRFGSRWLYSNRGN